MYLFARLCGVFIYAIILVLICTQINNGGNTCKYLNTYIVLIAVMGYLFVPPDSFDINRLIERMYYYGDLTFDKLIQSMSSAKTPGEQLYYWLIRKLNNDNMLKAISGFLSFSLCFSTLKRECKRNEYDKHIKAITCSTVLYLFMSRGLLPMAVSNIRSMLSSSIIAWCLYREYMDDVPVWKHVVLYILAASFHALGQSLMLIRFLFLIVEKNDTGSQKIKRTTTALVLSVIVLTVFRNYVMQLSSKLTDYAEKTNGYSYVWEGLLSSISMALTVYDAVIYKRYIAKKRTNKTNGFSNFIKFSLMITMLSTLFVFVEFNTFMRLGCFLAIIQIPILFRILCTVYYNNKQNYYIIRSNIIVIATIMLAIASSRGYLCSLKFFQ